MGDTLTLDLEDTAVVTPEVPRLSPSIAKDMLRCPAHGYQAHRLLGGGKSLPSTDAQNTGKILEALVFNVPLEKFAILDFGDWRTKEAKQAADDAEAEGKTPLLAKAFEVHQTAARIIRERIAEYGVEFAGGEYQKLLEWTCGLTGALCKGYPDYFQAGVIHDLKTTTDASPSTIQRQFVKMNNDVQGVAYIEGVEAMIPALAGKADMIFWYAETVPPFLVAPYRMNPEMRMLGAEKWHRAKQEWVECQERKMWPGYFSGIFELAPTTWQLTEAGLDAGGMF